LAARFKNSLCDADCFTKLDPFLLHNYSKSVTLYLAGKTAECVLVNVHRGRGMAVIMERTFDGEPAVFLGDRTRAIVL
jgi:hypothetical protein